MNNNSVLVGCRLVKRLDALEEMIYAKQRMKMTVNQAILIKYRREREKSSLFYFIVETCREFSSCRVENLLYLKRFYCIYV